MTTSSLKPWSREHIPNLNGKVCIVTGGTGGIGYATAIGLATVGAEVIIIGRNEGKWIDAVKKMKDATTNLAVKIKVSFGKVDLGNLGAIAEFAKTFNDRGVALDILVNNAGILTSPNRDTTVDGFEVVFGTNHLGHFALTAQLLPSLRKSASPRVINVSSGIAKMGSIDFDDLQWEKKNYAGMGPYSQSKLANFLFTFELQRKSDANGWGLTAIVVNPGLVKTDITVIRPGYDSFFAKLTSWILMPLFSQEPDEGASSSLFAATSMDAKSAGYYGPGGFLNMNGTVTTLSPPNSAKDLKTAEKLWQVSEQLTKVIWA